jgi:hypothetical protein
MASIDDYCWKKGDVVRVLYHSNQPLAVGLVFKIERFSSMDHLDHCPILKNPWYDPQDRMRSPTYLRFQPDWLVEADALERMTVI